MRCLLDNIWKIVSHRNPHMDELVAIALMLIQIPDAIVRFCDESDVSESDKLDPNIAFVGMLGGRFDEHRPEGRLPDMCATLLVAYALEIRDLPMYQTLLAETLRADTTADQGHFELGTMVKTIQEHGDDNMDDFWTLGFVRQVVHSHLSAVEQRAPRLFRRFYAPCIPPKSPVAYVAIPTGASFPTIVKAWVVLHLMERKFQTVESPELIVLGNDEEFERACKRSDVLFVGFEGGHYPDLMKAREVASLLGVSGKKDAHAFGKIKAVLKEVEAFEENPGSAKPFSLGAIVENLNRHSDLPFANIFEEVTRILDAYVRRSVEFHELCPLNFKETGKVEGICGLIVAFVESDLRSMAAYARSVIGADVVVIRRTGGNVAIFTQNQKPVAEHIAKAIFMAEARIAEKRDASAEKLEQAITTGRGQELPEPASHWYYFVESGCLLNGSHSHTDVPPTRLSNRDLKGVIESALQSYSA